MTTNTTGSTQGRATGSSAARIGADQPGAEPELTELLGQLRSRIDGLRSGEGIAGGHASSPSELALAVVAEALAIGEAMSRVEAGAESNHAGVESPAVYAAIDSRFVEHRTRALRSALHGVDDYVWWGGLATAAS